MSGDIWVTFESRLRSFGKVRVVADGLYAKFCMFFYDKHDMRLTIVTLPPESGGKVDKQFLRPVKTHRISAKARARIKALQQSRRKRDRDQADSLLKAVGVETADACATYYVRHWDNIAQLRRHLQKTFKSVELCG